MPMADYLREKMYDHTLRNVAYTAPANLYVEFCKDTTVPTNSSAGTPSGAGRATLTMADDGGDGSGISSALALVSGVPYGTYRYVEVYDASSSGNRLFYAQMSDVALAISGSLYINTGLLIGTIAGAATDYLREKWYDHVFRATTFTSPAAIYAELCTSAVVPTNTTAGTASGAGRQAITFADDGGDGAGVTSNAPAFAGLSAGTTYSYMEIWDASSSGNRLLYTTLSVPITGVTSITLNAGNGSAAFT